MNSHLGSLLAWRMVSRCWFISGAQKFPPLTVVDAAEERFRLWDCPQKRLHKDQEVTNPSSRFPDPDWFGHRSLLVLSSTGSRRQSGRARSDDEKSFDHRSEGVAEYLHEIGRASCKERV